MEPKSKKLFSSKISIDRRKGNNSGKFQMEFNPESTTQGFFGC